MPKRYELRITLIAQEGQRLDKTEELIGFEADTIEAELRKVLDPFYEKFEEIVVFDVHEV